jgi:hypothetical protein
MTINWTLIEQIDFDSGLSSPSYSAIYIDFIDGINTIYQPLVITALNPAVAEYIVTSGGPPGPSGSNITFSVCVNDIINFGNYSESVNGPLKLRIWQIGDISSPSLIIYVLGYSFIANWSAITTNSNSPHFATAIAGPIGP